MSLTSMGDLSQQFATARNITAIKADLARAVDAMSSGEKSDITLELGGDTSQFAGVQHRLAQVEAYQQATIETEQVLSQMQLVLGKVDDIRSATAEQLLLVSGASSENQLNSAASTARSAFGDLISSLNTTVADRALLGGDRVEGAPLSTPEAILADIQTEIGGAVDAVTITARLDAWFNDPAGGFATMGYRGDSGEQSQRRISQDRTIAIEARADDPEIRQVLKGAALAALADTLTGLDSTTRATLLQDAAVDLQSSASGLVEVRSRVGSTQEKVAATRSENSAQQSALEQVHNQITLADPYETATQLQALQLQLETAFSITARMSQLSLLRYL